MRSIILFSLIALLSQSSRAQRIDSVNYDSIKNMEYQLEGLSHNIINSADLEERITSCYYFVQTLKKALKVPQSFEYDFELLKTVSILKPKDEKFRLFTWNLLLDSGRYMYFGALQMNNEDSLILYGLYDSSDKMRTAEFEVLDHKHWVGSLYYQIHDYKYKKQKYYLLFGWDGEDATKNRKIIDVLTFDDKGKPQFGAPIFEINDDIQHRVIFEFADQAVMLCRYEERDNMIVYAHMVPPNPMQKGMYQYYLPDGTYDFFKFKKGFWVGESLYFLDRKENSHLLREY